MPPAPITPHLMVKSLLLVFARRMANGYLLFAICYQLSAICYFA